MEEIDEEGNLSSTPELLRAKAMKTWKTDLIWFLPAREFRGFIH